MNFKRVLTVICPLLLLVCASSYKVDNQYLEATDYTFVQVDPIPTNLQKGSSFVVPSAKFGNIDAECFVCSPDHKVFTTKTVLAENQGTYVLKYFANVDGKKLSHNVALKIGNPLYYFDDTNSNAEMSYDNTAKRSGLHAKVYKDSVFHYNKVVDLNECDYSNPALDFTLLQNVKDQNDAKIVNVKFIDAYNKDNFVDFWINLGYGNEALPWYYSRARANEQVFKGFEGSKLHINAYGTPLTFSAFDQIKNEEAEIDQKNIQQKQHISLWVDPETNEAFIKYFHFSANLDYTAKIVDLDDFEYQESSFNGFKTGEVYIDISFSDYISDYSNLLVLGISNHDLSKKENPDLNYPEIEVNFNEFDEDNLPDGSNGLYYPVFSANGFDKESGGNIPHTTNVYYNYTRKTGTYHTVSGLYAKEISIENNCFKTDRNGVYSIVYRTKDYVENYTEKVVSINVSDIRHDLYDLILNNTCPSTCEIGDKVRLNDVISVKGGVGNKRINNTIFFNNKEIIPDGNEIDGYSFVPSNIGQYKIETKVIDALHNEIKESYLLSVCDQTSPSFIETPNLPKYIFNNQKYVLPNAYGLKMSTGETTIASINVSDKNGKKTNVQNKTITLCGDAENNIKIEYALGNKSLVYNLPVIDVKNSNDELILNNYFEKENFVGELTDNSIRFTTNNSNANSLFINSLLDNELSASFLLNEICDSFDSFFIKLKDSLHPSQQITFKLINNNGFVDAVYNESVVAKNIFSIFDIEKRLNIKFNNLTNELSLNGSSKISISETDFGFKFEGFTSSKVYLYFGIENAKSNASIDLMSINNQMFKNSVTVDKISPYIKITENYEYLNKKIGDEVKIFGAIASDVLSPYTSIQVSAYDTDGEIVVAKDGTELSNVAVTDKTDLSFVLNKYSLDKYNGFELTYKAKDWSKSSSSKTLSFTFTVNDDTKPVINLNGEISTNNKIGWINLPTYSVSDNSENVSSYISVLKPDYTIEILDKNVFKFYAFDVGIYVIDYVAIDEQGNMANQSFKILVSK